MSLLSHVESSDVEMSLRLCRWAGPRRFRRLMQATTRLGDGWLWPAGAVALALLHADQRAHAIGELAIAALIANVALVVLKRCCQRRRPAELLAAHGAASITSELFAFDRFSFPSGHALNAFAVVTVLALRFPLAAPGLILLASSIAASRVFLGRHFLGDVLVGSAIGTALGLTAVLLGAY